MKSIPFLARWGGAMLAMILVAALLANVIGQHAPTAQPFRDLALQPPSPAHPLGVDAVGRDFLTRLLYGARVTLGIAIAATAIAVVGGTIIGMLAASLGGLVDVMVREVTDFLLAFPSILLGLVLLTLLDPSAASVALAVGLAGLPPVVRQIRAAYRSEQARDYVLAAAAVGAGRWRIATREVLPNCVGLIVVLTTLSLGSAVMEAAGLSFLGLSGQPDVPEWGSMLRESWRSFRVAPWLCIAPGVAIAWTVLAFNLLGDGLRAPAARGQGHSYGG